MERRAYPISACHALIEAHDLETGDDYVKILDLPPPLPRRSQPREPAGPPIMGLVIICAGCVVFGMLLGWLIAEAF